VPSARLFAIGSYLNRYSAIALPFTKRGNHKPQRQSRTVIDATRSVETNLGKHLPFPFGCNSLLDDELTLVVVELHPHGLHRLPNKLEVI
jgi:hypothetical protein